MVDEVSKAGGELSGGEAVGDMAGKAWGELGGGEVAEGVAGKTGGELGGREEVVPFDDAGEISFLGGEI